MTSSPARQLILGYAAIAALTYLYVLIPGDSWYGSGPGLFFWVAVDILVVWQLWQGSAGAWLFALCRDLLGIVLLIFIGPELELAAVLILASAVAQLLILVSGPVRAHVGARPRPRTASS